MKHLVLGSAGQIGTHLIEAMISKGIECLTFDITDSLNEDLRIYDNKELEKLIVESDFIHFLAFDIGGSSYMKKYQDTFQFISNNVKIMNNVFDLIKKYDKPFIFASSQMSNMTYSTYGILKAIGEKYTSSLNGIVVKFWNVYGYEKDEEKSHVITDFIKMAKYDGVIKMRTNGEESRQFLYADDCSDCLLKLSDNYSTIDRGKDLHITNFQWTSIMDVAKIVQSVIKCQIIPGEEIDSVQLDKRNEPNPYILQFWSPKISLLEGIDILEKKY